jgi:hypothetical protein
VALGGHNATTKTRPLATVPEQEHQAAFEQGTNTFRIRIATAYIRIATAYTAEHRRHGSGGAVPDNEERDGNPQRNACFDRRRDFAVLLLRLFHQSSFFHSLARLHTPKHHTTIANTHSTRNRPLEAQFVAHLSIGVFALQKRGHSSSTLRQSRRPPRQLRGDDCRRERELK